MANYLRLISLLAAALFATFFFVDVASAGADAMDEAEVWAGISEEINEAPAYEDPEADMRKWSLTIGVGGGVSPDYEGSNDYESGFGPNFIVTWRDTIFYRGNSLGVNIIRRALEEPIRQISGNAGEEGSIIVQRVRDGKGDFGYNAHMPLFAILPPRDGIQ